MRPKGLFMPLPEPMFRPKFWTDLTSQLVAGDNYGVSYDRAASITRYQCNMARAVMENTRCLELGITQAIWQHSGGGKAPRPSHVAFSGKRFKLATGAYLDGKWVWPGSALDCLCTSRAIIPGFED